MVQMEVVDERQQRSVDHGHAGAAMTHWLTMFDPDDGEPVGSLCNCDLDEDHDGAGNTMFPLFPLEPGGEGHGDTQA